MRGRAVAAFGLLTLVTMLWLPWSPAGAEVPDDVSVIFSRGVASAIGVTSRVPAESAGGLVFSRSTITLDKTVAQAAAFTAGELAETFFTTSSEDYRNPGMVTAQHPPSAVAPEDASFEGEQTAPAGSPFAGRAGSIHARADGQPRAQAEAAGAALAHQMMTVGSGSSSSLSELREDGTLVTLVEGIAQDVRIGDVLTIAQARTVGETLVPATGEPSSRLEVTVSGARAGGVPVEIGVEGVRVADAAALTPDQVAAANAALATLAAQGITVAAVPAEQEASGDTARASGAAVVVRYSLAPQIGGDEEFRLAAVAAAVTLERRIAVLEPLPALELPAAAITDVVLPAPVPEPLPSSNPLVLLEGIELVASPAEVGIPGYGYPEAPVAAAPAPTLGFTIPVSDPAADPLRTVYGGVVLCAFLGVALLVARLKSTVL